MGDINVPPTGPSPSSQGGNSPNINNAQGIVNAIINATNTLSTQFQQQQDDSSALLQQINGQIAALEKQFGSGPQADLNIQQQIGALRAMAGMVEDGMNSINTGIDGLGLHAGLVNQMLAGQ